MPRPSATPAARNDPVIEEYKRHLDRAALRKNLRLTHEQRFLQLMELQRLAAELRDAGRRARKR